MTSKDHIFTFRGDDALKAYLYGVAKKKDLPVGEVIRELVRLGMENRKELDKRLDKIRIQYTELQEMQEHDTKIKSLTAKAFLFHNSKNLIAKMGTNSNISQKYAGQVVREMHDKIVRVYGANSKEAKEAATWLQRLKESD